MVLVVVFGDEPQSVKTPGAVFFSYVILNALPCTELREAGVGP